MELVYSYKKNDAQDKLDFIFVAHMFSSDLGDVFGFVVVLKHR